MRRLALAAALPFLICGAASADTGILSVPVGLKHLIGAPLGDFTGERRGTTEDFVVDVANGSVRYAVLRTQGRRIAYPFAPLQLSLDGRRLLIDETEERIAHAPALSDCPGDWAAYWAGGKPPILRSASQIVGSPVTAPDGRAELVDIAIDAHAGKVAFAVVRLPENRLHPMPLAALSPKSGGFSSALAFATLDPAYDITPQELAQLRDRPLLARRAAMYAEGLLP